MVVRPNNDNIVLRCDCCGAPIYLNESYYEFSDGKQICGNCMYEYIKYILFGDY